MTTIVCVKKDQQIVIAGDGQVSLGQTVMKANARKVRRLYKDQVIAGFAGATADAFTLFEKFEAQLQQHSGHLQRAAVELAKEWRSDRALRKLEAMLLVANAQGALLISGTGDVIEPEHGVLAIGSGGQFAMAAGRALLAHSTLSAQEIAETALSIAADICVYTNHQQVVEIINEAQ